VAVAEKVVPQQVAIREPEEYVHEMESQAFEPEIVISKEVSAIL